MCAIHWRNVEPTPPREDFFFFANDLWWQARVSRRPVSRRTRRKISNDRQYESSINKNPRLLSMRPSPHVSKIRVRLKVSSCRLDVISPGKSRQRRGSVFSLPPTTSFPFLFATTFFIKKKKNEKNRSTIVTATMTVRTKNKKIYAINSAITLLLRLTCPTARAKSTITPSCRFRIYETFGSV